MDRTDWKRELSALREGDEGAFARIYEEWKKPVYTIIFRIVQSKETAEDVMQEVFVKLYLSPPEPSVENPRAWVFAVARNAAIDALRKSARREEDRTEMTEDPADTTVLRMDVERAMAHLTREEREIVTLHLNGDMGFGEIGRLIGLSLPAVYRRYRKAIRTLRDRLNGGNV